MSGFDRLEVIKNKGYYPDTILDIGAYHGNWTKSVKRIFDNSKYYLFEAINYPVLKDIENADENIKVFNVLLNEKIEEVEWYEMQNTGDSMFKEKTHHFLNCNVYKRTSIDLNTLIKREDILENSKNILIKIDCQGAEISILKGSTNILDKTDFILLEMPFFGKYNEGVSNFLEHIKYMESIDFVPYDIIENHYINNF